MSDFKTSCPRCKATPEDAMLEVVSGIFRARAMYLNPDGFATMHAKQFDTDEEQVYCHACEQTMSLGECLDDEMNDGPDEQAVAGAAERISTAIDHILTDTNTPSRVLAAALRQLAKELGG